MPSLPSPSTPPPSTPPLESVGTPLSFSDDSVFEGLSFEYVVNEDGQVVRRPRSGRFSSHQSSPPTPFDSPNDQAQSSKSTVSNTQDNQSHPSSLSNTARRSSLSQSESIHSLFQEHDQEPLSHAAPRVLMRTASTPATSAPSVSRLLPQRPISGPRYGYDGQSAEDDYIRQLDEKENMHEKDSAARVVAPLPLRSSRALSEVAPLQQPARNPARVTRALKSVKYGLNTDTERESASEAELRSESELASDQRQRSGSALSHSSSTRSRRSASLSDTLNNEQSMPQSGSLIARTNQSQLYSSFGPRRVTLDDHQDFDDPEGRDLEDAERFSRARLATDKRQSPSPTHMNSAASSHLDPRLNHQRRDSDTLRTVGPGASTPASTVAETRHSAISSRLSPTGRGQIGAAAMSSSVLALQNRHKRNPTAPETSSSNQHGDMAVPTSVGKTWTTGDAHANGDRAEYQGRLSSRANSNVAIPPAAYHEPGHMRAAPLPPGTTSSSTKNIFLNKQRFTRLDMIGKGGSSRVYRVMSDKNEIYAIKRVSLDKTDEETMKGYMNEIALLKRLDGNSRIIRLIDSELKVGSGSSKGHLLLLMECGEIDLARLLQEQQREPMNMVWISYYWQQMLEAVHIIHEEKIVHSDLKPANFVLVRGQLKLIDFGIANAIANDTTNIQRDHQIGTVNYMSPEAIEVPDGMPRLKVGRPSDVWSLGCILYQMVYGHPPFQHLSMFQKMKAIPDSAYVIEFPEFSTPYIKSSGDSSPRRLEHLRRSVRKDVIAGMKSCLCRSPKERATIPELLNQDWLAMPDPAPPKIDAKNMLSHDETIINPYYMAQLLNYGIKIGRESVAEMSEEDIMREAERLVQELKMVDSS